MQMGGGERKLNERRTLDARQSEKQIDYFVILSFLPKVQEGMDSCGAFTFSNPIFNLILIYFSKSF